MATGTDSFMYYVETNDIYKDMLHNLYLYDKSNYPKESIVQFRTKETDRHDER